MVFHWSVSDRKSPQVSRKLLSILADLNNAIVWMVSTRPLILKSSCPSANPSVTVLSVPIAIDITVTFIFHSFFSSLARSRYLPFFSLSFSFIPWLAGTTKAHYSAGSLFFSFLFFSFTITGSEFCASHFLEWILGCAYTICSYCRI